MAEERQPSTPLAVKAVNLMGAGAEAVRRAVTPGESVFVSNAVAASRLSLCHKCPMLVKGECDHCGCPVTRKVRLAGEECPEKKWLSERGIPSKGVVRGADLLRAEMDLRLVVPAGKLAEEFNNYHRRMNSKMRCKSCEVNAFVRKFELALGADFAMLDYDAQVDLRAALPNKEHVMFASMRKWDDVMKNPS